MSLVGYIKVSSDESATALKNTAMVAYSAHMKVLKNSTVFHYWLMESE